MKKNKRELVIRIEKYLKMIFNDKDKIKYNELKTLLVSKGYNVDKVVRMTTLNQAVEIWNDKDLLIMTWCIDKIDKEILSIDTFYNKLEIEEAEKYKEINKKNNVNVMMFENAIRTSDRQFMIGAVDIHKLKEYYDNFLIGYKPELQRDLIRKKDKNGELIEKINLNSGKVSEIAQKIINGKFYTNAINLNVLDTDSQIVKYNEETKKLIIEFDENSTEVDIIDGFHRLSGFMTAIELKPNVEFYTSINLSILDRESAGEFIRQEDLHTPLSKGKARLLSTTNPFVEISKKINKSGNPDNNILFNKLAEDINELNVNENKLCTYEVFANAVKYNFFDDKEKKNEKLKPARIDEVNEFLIKGFNKIFDVLATKAKNKELKNTNFKKKGVYIENNIFIGYIALLAKVEEEENWRKAIERILDKVDFSYNNPLWIDLEISSEKINKSIIKKISLYFSKGGEN